MTRKSTPLVRKLGAAPAERAITTALPAVAVAPSGSSLPRLLSLAEVVEVLGCSLKTLRRRIAAQELPVIRDGRLLRVHPQDLARYVAARRSL